MQGIIMKCNNFSGEDEVTIIFHTNAEYIILYEYNGMQNISMKSTQST